MHTLTEQQRQENRDLYRYVWHILCETCRMVIAERSDPDLWEACRKTGKCSVCMKAKPEQSGEPLVSMSFDSNTWRADFRTHPRD